MSIPDHDAHYTLRSDLRAALRSDLLGPQGGPHEVLADDAPITAYLIGVLFPRVGEDVTVTTDDESSVEDAPDVVSGDDPEQGTADLGVALTNRRKPSSMGLTFGVAPEITGSIYVTVRAAQYAPEDENGLPVEPKRSDARSTEQQKERWRRVPTEYGTVSIMLTSTGMQEPVALCPGLELRTLVRRADRDGVVTVTVTIVNTLRTGEFDLQDAYCFFQPEIVVSGPQGTLPFVERAVGAGAVDAEQALSRLLHRHAPSFAVGHGCSVAWEWEPPAVRAPIPDRAAVARLRTEFIPTHEVLLTDSNPTIDDNALGMSGLGSGSREEVASALSRLLDGYQSWIEDRSADADVLAGTDYASVADEQITLCRESLARMRRGLALLADTEQPKVLQAFQLANQAMAQQRARSKWIKDGRIGSPDTSIGRWRPFQIAFMLLCLEGIVDPDHEDRKVADLLWFPTGGGKTEAYLGLIAFTVFLRRLRDNANGGGVTVLMRYTLRLLTLQQFERATVLICAMERVRNEHRDLGATRISIGMWVGRSATPNYLKDAEIQLEDLRKNPLKSLQRENPVQLQNCPWCGEPLSASDYDVRIGLCRMLVHCPNAVCAFHEGDGLPIHLVDEAVYDARPTLVISTVDKFASMPWRPETKALFNRDIEGVKPPELIVQDELHLISGPLGTLTGLYETAVDVLAEQPKVIASTATIRRASNQVGALFDRETAQFPPAGVDSRDSWFAVETPRQDKASRRYVGLFTPSGSQATLLVRTYAALLNAAYAAAAEADPKVVDAYWTLVGYFNSLRLLSAAELQVFGDVQDRLEVLAKRDDSGSIRSANALIELSSRADSSEIPRRLKILERELPDPDVLDVLLATNMISVGVDIDRLGLMAVMGQPQTTAEYIQATSRVGRRHPGLVAVMFNSSRSRDRSHYEKFPSFHSALYREVESTSVTPFSSRSRDRGLHAVIVALTRLMIPRASDNKAAGRIEEYVGDINSKVIPRILDRARQIDDAELESTRTHCENFVEWWRTEAEDNPDLVYEAKRGSRQRALLSGFDDDSNDGAGWSTLWSLRDVDAESTLFYEKNKGATK
ncbi:helicase-related protein [Rhodococcus koreensis]|uniref:Helicase conserved C-terminal domain-containing protein n=1 Tax=Rhodococcus koreensis TaxID=99653 RepID=A0A1H4ZR22_9NOCA|nr:helicase-related protein [Rhodococcus koreensis]SED32542.1 Helicase conserved C-terminal domain-containing protein [Rhodococcus koreensis]